jgi:hypothetical protein
MGGLAHAHRRACEGDDNVYLSYSCGGVAHHVVVQHRSGLFFVGLRAFLSLSDAVAYFRTADVDPGADPPTNSRPVFT